MNTISYSKFKSCIDVWTKQKVKGEHCLGRLELGESSHELDQIVNSLKEALDTMTEEYISIVNQLGLEETVINEDENQQNIPKELISLRDCLDMYDQEYMVKECIRGIVTGEGFATRQHLAGSIALWKSESYLDEDLINEIKQL